MKAYEITNKNGKIFCEENYNTYFVGNNFIVVQENINYQEEVVKGIFKKRKEYIDKVRQQNVLLIPIQDVYSIRYIEIKEK